MENQPTAPSPAASRPNNWILFATLFAVAYLIGVAAEHYRFAEGVRHAILQEMMDFSPRQLEWESTPIVEVDDAARKKFGGRLFELLGKCVSAADSREARAIGLDYNFAVNVEPPVGVAPEEGIESLVQALATAANKRPVVLPVSISKERDGQVQRVPSLLDRWPELSAVLANPGISHRLAFGFLNADDSRDPRKIPKKRWIVNTQEQVWPFSVALARAATGPRGSLRLRGYEELGPQARPPVIQFIPQVRVQKINALEFIAPPPGAQEALRDKTRAMVVVIGGDYVDAVNPVADRQVTPVGPMAGVAILAQQTEAVLDGHLVTELGSWNAFLIKFIASVALFATMSAPLKTRAAILLAVIVLIPISAYLFLINFAIGFDFLLPLAVILAHYFVDVIHHHLSH